MSDRLVKVLQFTALLVSAGCMLYAVAVLILNADRGFDITDDSFILLSADSAEKHIGATSQAGTYTGVLYDLAGGDVTDYRILGLGIFLVLAAGFAVLLDRLALRLFQAPPAAWLRWAWGFALMAAALVYYHKWLIAPSYNWMTLAAILLTVNGLIIAGLKTALPHENRATRIHLLWLLLAAVLIGIGGGLTFMSRLTSAALLAPVALLWIHFVVHAATRIKLALISLGVIAAAGVFAVHFAVFAGPLELYEDIRTGFDLTRALESDHGVLGLISDISWEFVRTAIKSVETAWPLWVLLGIILAAYRYYSPARIRLSAHPEAVLVGLLLVSAGIIWIMGGWKGGYFGGQSSKFSLGLLNLAAVSLLVWAILLKNQTSDGERKGAIAWSVVPIIALLFLFAHAYGIGSGIAKYKRMSDAFVFLAGAYYVLWLYLVPRSWKAANALAPALIALIGAYAVYGATQIPYRQVAPLSEHTETLTMRQGRVTLRVDEATAKYLRDLQAIADEAGFEANTPLLDFTGASPGATYALGARFVSRPWLIGGYKGSDETIRQSLKLAPQQTLKEAWILTAPGGERRISLSVLEDLGLDFPGGYTKVGTVTSGHRAEKQILWKPKAPESQP